MTVRAERDSVGVAEPLKLTVAVDAPEGVDVEMPELHGRLGEWEIRDVRRRPAVPVDGQRWWEHEYTLEALLPGEHAVPEIEATFIDRRGGAQSGRAGEGERGRGGDQDTSLSQGSYSRDADATARAESQRISTPPLSIAVSSLIEGEFDPLQFRDIKGAVQVPVATSWAMAAWIAGAAAALAVLAGVLLWLARGRRGRRQARKLEPHVWAFGELRRLEQAALIERGQVQEFYFRLSDIVRQYIERRFSMRAPEQTTDEFLAEVRNDSVLSLEHKELLGGFLVKADLVKFALHEPDRDEAEAALAAARDFVEQTAGTVSDLAGPPGVQPPSAVPPRSRAAGPPAGAAV